MPVCLRDDDEFREKRQRLVDKTSFSEMAERRNRLKRPPLTEITRNRIMPVYSRKTAVRGAVHNRGISLVTFDRQRLWPGVFRGRRELSRSV